jgi:hypothetical protein
MIQTNSSYFCLNSFSSLSSVDHTELPSLSACQIVARSLFRYSQFYISDYYQINFSFITVKHHRGPPESVHHYGPLFPLLFLFHFGSFRWR